MADRPSLEGGFRLGDWEVRPRHGTLCRVSAQDVPPVQIEPRVMAVLVCLARRAGEVVTRDEFIAEVWAGRVVTDEALSRCVSLLRHALDDDSREPRFIRTVAKIGYTLLQAPTPLPAAATAAEDAFSATPAPDRAAPAPAPAESLATDAARSAAPPAAVPQGPAPRRGRRTVIAIAALLATAATLAIIVVGRRAPTQPAEPPPPASTIAVLPFDGHNAHGIGRDVGDELADEIADVLARVPGLRVTGRISARRIVDQHLSPAEAGRVLGVGAILDGTVTGDAGGLSVAARLTATSDGHAMWSKTYELDPADIPASQSGIASAAAREVLAIVKPDAPPGPPSAEPGPRDLRAYQLYLRGAHQLRLRGEDSLRRAIDLFTAATRRDPSYARPYVGLANAYALLPAYSFEEPKEMYALAERALATAERLAGSRAISAGTRAYLEFKRWHWLEAESAYRTAIAADPNNPELRQFYSQLLGAVGRLGRALEEAHTAFEIDPLAPVVADRLGVLHLWLGRDEEAANDFDVARELGLEEAAYPETKVILKLHQHADAAAAETLHDLQRTVHRSDAWIEVTLDAYRHPERRPAAIRLLDRAQKSGEISPRLYFGAMVMLESADRALRAFSDLIDRDANDLEFLFSADAAAVRRDPAFADFVRRFHLETYWDRYGWPGACRREEGRIVCR
jgi:DNA-binding winged helix-turn-helix (wHTH) protein/TolB-like protein